MATSGNYRYNVTAGDIINIALSKVGARAIGESVDASESAEALIELNLLLKTLQSKAGIWLNREVNLFFANAQAEYDLGPTGDHAATGAVKTELAAAAASGATSLTIDATTGFGDTFDRNGIITAVTATGAGAITLTGALVAAGIATLSGNRKVLVYAAGNESARTFAVTGQNAAGVAVTESITGPNATTVYSSNNFKTITSITIDAASAGNFEIGQVGDPIGIEQDNDTLHWTFIAGALSTTPSLVTALTGAAAIDNHVYTYVSMTQRPVNLIEARLHKADGHDVPLLINGRLDYRLLSNKTQTGTPNQIYYDKQLNNGVIQVWPVPTDMQEYIKMSARLPIQRMDNLTDDFEVGQEWGEPLAWTLTVRLYPNYGRKIPPDVALMAERMLADAMMADTEDGVVRIRFTRSRS